MYTLLIDIVLFCRYPDRLWHKPSYNSYIDWPLRGVDVFANWTAQQTTGKFKQFTYLQASKLEMEGESSPHSSYHMLAMFPGS